MLQKLLQNEPAALIAVVTAIVGAAVSFGLLTQTRADAWIAVVAALLPIILPILQGYFTRQNAFAPATVQKIADAATQLPPGTPVDIGSPPNTDASPPLPPPVLTDADAAADLAGTPRPDNPTQ
jgi:hypothetical protein